MTKTQTKTVQDDMFDERSPIRIIMCFELYTDENVLKQLCDAHSLVFFIFLDSF